LKEADEIEKKAREKQARVEASMKEREKEVKESLETSMRERDKERDQHKKDEATQTFKALLVDLVSGLHPRIRSKVFIKTCMTAVFIMT
jgi:transcription elongation regulator 1